MTRKVLSEKSSLVTTKLDRLKTLYMDVISGKAKNTMVNEYLTTIREETNKYLASKGYNHAAVGDNYIEEAPSDIEAVKTNAKLCHDILSESNDPNTEFRAFVREICKKSYSRIDAWIADVELVLSLELDEPVTPQESFIERVEDILASDTRSKNTDVYRGLLQDVEYCQRMKELESAEKTHSLDIVPISGLVYSRVTRMEKECLTVIDIWDVHKKHVETKAATEKETVVSATTTTGTTTADTGVAGNASDTTTTSSAPTSTPTAATTPKVPDTTVTPFENSECSQAEGETVTQTELKEQKDEKKEAQPTDQETQQEQPQPEEK